MNHQFAKGVVQVIAAASLWGTAGTAQQLGAGNLHPAWVGALSLLVGAVFLAVVGLASDRRQPASAVWRSAGPRMRIAVLAGTCMALNNIAFFLGLDRAGVAVGTAVAIGSAPIWAGVIEACALGRHHSARWWAGACLAVMGAVGMSLTGAKLGPSDMVGVALCLLAGLAYAGYAQLSSRLAQFQDSVRTTALVFSCSASIALPAAFFVAGGSSLLSLGGPAIWTVSYLGVIVTGVAYMLFTEGLRVVDGSTAVTLTLAEPLAAFGLAISLSSERPTIALCLGFMLVLVGLSVVARSPGSTGEERGPSCVPASPACVGPPVLDRACGKE